MLTSCATNGTVSGRYYSWRPGTVFRVPQDVPAGEFDHLGPGRYEIRPQEGANTSMQPSSGGPQYEVQEREANGWYDVVGPSGEAVNGKALRQDDAERIAKRLNG